MGAAIFKDCNLSWKMRNIYSYKLSIDLIRVNRNCFEVTKEGGLN
jgi:hypothetical protein